MRSYDSKIETVGGFLPIRVKGVCRGSVSVFAHYASAQVFQGVRRLPQLVIPAYLAACAGGSFDTISALM